MRNTLNIYKTKMHPECTSKLAISSIYAARIRNILKHTVRDEGIKVSVVPRNAGRVC
jgi:hypothetical protein